MCWRGEMTGGRRRPDEYESVWPPRPSLRPPTADEAATLAALTRFMSAMKFRRALHRALRPLGISFAEWRALEATWRRTRETGEPVSQLDVARQIELDESSVSRLMGKLSERGLVSHDIDARGVCYRVIMNVKGDHLVGAAYRLAARIEARTRA